jgi:hypothetical protein
LLLGFIGVPWDLKGGALGRPKKNVVMPVPVGMPIGVATGEPQ